MIARVLAVRSGSARLVEVAGSGALQRSRAGNDALAPEPLPGPHSPTAKPHAHRAFVRRYQSALEELNLNRNIFKSVTNGISVANAQLPDMPLMYVNPAFEVMTGYSLEDVEGKNCRFLQGEEKEQPGLTLIREAIAQKRETVAVIHNYRKDGTAFWNELSLSPIFNADGELTHFVGIQMNVTERVEFEHALRESEKLAAVGALPHRLPTRSTTLSKQS